MTQSAGVDAHSSALATRLKAPTLTFLVDAHFQDLVLVDSETGEHFPLHRRHRALPISKFRTYLRMLSLGLFWGCRQLEARKCLPPDIIHVDLTIHQRDVICASADFIRDEAGKWDYSPTNVLPVDAVTATAHPAS